MPIGHFQSKVKVQRLNDQSAHFLSRTIFCYEDHKMVASTCVIFKIKEEHLWKTYKHSKSKLARCCRQKQFLAKAGTCSGNTGITLWFCSVMTQEKREKISNIKLPKYTHTPTHITISKYSIQRTVISTFDI